MMLFMPSRALILVLIGIGAVLAALSGADAPQSTILQAAAASGAVLAAGLVIDGYLSLSAWKRAPLTLKRHLPRAFAVGAPVTMGLSLENGGARRHSGRLFDMADASMDTPSRVLGARPSRGEMVSHTRTRSARSLPATNTVVLRRASGPILCSASAVRRFSTVWTAWRSKSPGATTEPS